MMKGAFLRLCLSGRKNRKKAAAMHQPRAEETQMNGDGEELDSMEYNTRKSTTRRNKGGKRSKGKKFDAESRRSDAAEGINAAESSLEMDHKMANQIVDKKGTTTKDTNAKSNNSSKGRKSEGRRIEKQSSIMSNEAGRWEAHKTSSAIRAQAKTSISKTENERRKANGRTVVSIVSAESSIRSTGYERKKVDARTVTSIVGANTTMPSPEYERRKPNAGKVVSIVSAESTLSSTENDWRKSNARTVVSIVSAKSTLSSTENDWKKSNARTVVSIVNAESTLPSTPSEKRKPNAGTASSIEIIEGVFESKEEFILEDVQRKAGRSRAASPPPTDPLTLTVEEKLFVRLDKYGGISEFVVAGTLSLHILNQEDGFIQVQVESGGNPDILFETHPNINKEIFFSEHIICMKYQNMPFPSSQVGDEGGIGLLSWRLKIVDKSLVPLTIRCVPLDNTHSIFCCIEYEASTTLDMRNVMISIPLPALQEAPQVLLDDLEHCRTNVAFGYDSINSVLEWSILLINDSHRSGMLSFFTPSAAESDFFPISVQFNSASTFSGLKVTNVLQLRDGPPPKFAQRTQLITESYQVVN